MNINKSDVWEEIRYAFECPKCGEYNEECDISDISKCDSCGEEIEVLE